MGHAIIRFDQYFISVTRKVFNQDFSNQSIACPTDDGKEHVSRRPGLTVSHGRYRLETGEMSCRPCTTTLMAFESLTH